MELKNELLLVIVQQNPVAVFNTLRGADTYMADLKQGTDLTEDDFVIVDVEYWETEEQKT